VNSLCCPCRSSTTLRISTITGGQRLEEIQRLKSLPLAGAPAADIVFRSIKFRRLKAESAVLYKRGLASPQHPRKA
jgi:hypothetical protein